MSEFMETRKRTEIAIENAVSAWEKAPMTIKVMASPMVLPLLTALLEINCEIATLKQDLIKGVM